MTTDPTLQTMNDPIVTYSCPVTILIPARNAAPFLARSLKSVRAQSFQDWEAIIIDDGSHDDTASIAGQFADADPRIRIIRNDTGRGAARARNVGLAVAQGRFIAFLDADDEWHADKLTRQISHMEQYGAVLGYTAFARVTDGHRHDVRVPHSVTYATLLRGNCIGCLTAMYDRARVGSVPMPDLTMRHDYALWLNLLSGGETAYGLNDVLATHHATPASLSSNRVRAFAATWRMYRNHLNLGRTASARYLFSHLLRRVMRG